MKLKALLAGMLIALASTAAQAANNYLFQFDDTSPAPDGAIVENVFKNGSLMSSTTFSENNRDFFDFTLFNGATIPQGSIFSGGVTLFEPGTTIVSDEASAVGFAGDNFVDVLVRSDVEGEVLPVLGGSTHLDETGGFQTFQPTFTVSNGDTYTLQVASDVIEARVPEPATWAMMLVGLAGLGAAMRTMHRKSSAALAAARSGQTTSERPSQGGGLS